MTPFWMVWSKYKAVEPVLAPRYHVVPVAE